MRPKISDTDYLFQGISKKEHNRFWKKVDKSNDHDCWPWRAGIYPSGYGHFWFRKRSIGAHKFAWICTNGPVPPTMCVLHNCPDGDDKKCCNPSHLWIGTNADNSADMVAKHRQATGNRNGKYTHPENTPRGTMHGMAVLNEDAVLAIRKSFECDGETCRTLAARFGVGKSTIGYIVQRKIWKHV